MADTDYVSDIVFGGVRPVSKDHADRLVRRYLENRIREIVRDELIRCRVLSDQTHAD